MTGLCGVSGTIVKVTELGGVELSISIAAQIRIAAQTCTGER